MPARIACATDWLPYLAIVKRHANGPPHRTNSSGRIKVLHPSSETPRLAADQAPAEVYATLLDEGVCHCSIRTM